MTYDPRYYQPQPPQGYPPYPPPLPYGHFAYEMPRRHSGMGIASFVIGLVCGLSMAIMIVAAGMMHVRSAGRIDEKAPEVVALGCAMIIAAALCLLGTALGIAALYQPNRSKIFGALGLTINLGIILVTFGLWLIGQAAGG